MTEPVMPTPMEMPLSHVEMMQTQQYPARYALSFGVDQYLVRLTDRLSLGSDNILDEELEGSVDHLTDYLAEAAVDQYTDPAPDTSETLDDDLAVELEPYFSDRSVVDDTIFNEALKELMRSIHDASSPVLNIHTGRPSSRDRYPGIPIFIPTSARYGYVRGPIQWSGIVQSELVDQVALLTVVFQWPHVAAISGQRPGWEETYPIDESVGEKLWEWTDV